jgi:hypothetical protein
MTESKSSARAARSTMFARWSGSRLPLLVQIAPAGGRAPAVAHLLGPAIVRPGEILGPDLPRSYSAVAARVWTVEALVQRGWAPDAAAAAEGVASWGANWIGKV